MNRFHVNMSFRQCFDQIELFQERWTISGSSLWCEKRSRFLMVKPFPNGLAVETGGKPREACFFNAISFEEDRRVLRPKR